MDGDDRYARREHRPKRTRKRRRRRGSDALPNRALPRGVEAVARRDINDRSEDSLLGQLGAGSEGQHALSSCALNQIIEADEFTTAGKLRAHLVPVKPEGSCRRNGELLP